MLWISERHTSDKPDLRQAQKKNKGSRQGEIHCGLGPNFRRNHHWGFIAYDAVK